MAKTLTGSITAVATDDSAEDLERAPTHNLERDENQQALDKIVGTLAEWWAEAGKPDTVTDDAAFRAAKRSAVTTSKGDRRVVKDMLRRAGRLHKVEIVYFKDVPQPNGMIKLRFTVGPQPVKATENGASEPAQGEQPQGEQPQTGEQPQGEQPRRRFGR